MVSGNAPNVLALVTVLPCETLVGTNNVVDREGLLAVFAGAVDISGWIDFFPGGRTNIDNVPRFSIDHLRNNGFGNV